METYDLKFSERDLAEIYYALDAKLAAPTVQGNDSESIKWRSHLEEIMTRIERTGANI